MIPIDPTLLGGFIVAAVAIIVSPGPDTIVILRHALTGGRGTGLAAVTFRTIWQNTSTTPYCDLTQRSRTSSIFARRRPVMSSPACA